MILFCLSFGQLHNIMDKRHTNSTGNYDLRPCDCVNVRVRKFYGLQKRLVPTCILMIKTWSFMNFHICINNWFKK